MRTMAAALGETCHLSPLARKLRRFGLPSHTEWRQLAVQRGCRHYDQGTELVFDPGLAAVSNEELITALLLGSNPDDMDLVRIAGQLLAGRVNVERLYRLAKLERVSRRVAYIAEQGRQLEPTRAAWREILHRLPDSHYREGQLPHRTRFAVPVRKKGPAGLRQSPAWRWLAPNSSGLIDTQVSQTGPADP